MPRAPRRRLDPWHFPGQRVSVTLVSSGDDLRRRAFDAGFLETYASKGYLRGGHDARIDGRAGGPLDGDEAANAYDGMIVVEIDGVIVGGCCFKRNADDLEAIFDTRIEAPGERLEIGRMWAIDLPLSHKLTIYLLAIWKALNLAEDAGVVVAGTHPTMERLVRDWLGLPLCRVKPWEREDVPHELRLIAPLVKRGVLVFGPKADAEAQATARLEKLGLLPRPSAA